MALAQALPMIMSLITVIPVYITLYYIIKKYRLENRLLELQIREKEKALRNKRKS